MKKSLIDLKELLEQIATKHLNINDYHFGSYVEATSRDAVLYPLMIATIEPSTLSYKKTNATITLTLTDKYKESDYPMRDEVLSDLMEVASDIRALMRQEVFDDFEINETIPLRPFVNYGQDLTCGWMIDFTFEVDDVMNFCAVPMSGGIAPPPTIVCLPVTITDSDGTSIYEVASGGSFTCTPASQCSDATQVIKDSSGTVLYTNNIPSGTSADQTITDSTVTNSNTTYSASVKAQGSLILPDITHIDPQGNNVILPAQTPFNATTYKSGIAYNPAIPSGQLTSYRVGDEGWQLANGFYTYTRPTYPINFAQLDFAAVEPFLTLLNNNAFGNKNRFTDDAGGQTYANNVVVDNLTRLAWYRLPQGPSDWNGNIDAANASTLAGYSGWRLSSRKEIFDIVNHKANLSLQYAPFNINNSGFFIFQTSATSPFSTTLCSTFISYNIVFGVEAKTQTNRYGLYCRNHY